jgi:diaphanous 1
VTQKAALEVHDVEEVQANKPLVITTVEVEESRDTEMLAPPSSQGRAVGTMKMIEHGALDQTIRSMRDGKRRARPGRRPLSKMFIDGGRG